jgi:hypothetical protein
MTLCCLPAAEVTLLDYGAGNVRSIRNAIHLLGFNIREVRSIVVLDLLLLAAAAHHGFHFVADQSQLQAAQFPISTNVCARAGYKS